MFAYCKNNPVNMEDDDGTRPMPINGDQSPEITQVSCEIMNSWVQRTYHPSAYHPSRSSSYNILSSAGKSTASGIADGARKKAAGMVIKGIGAAIISAFALPEILVGAGVFIAGAGVSKFIDYAANKIRRKYYGRD